MVEMIEKKDGRHYCVELDDKRSVFSCEMEEKNVYRFIFKNGEDISQICLTTEAVEAMMAIIMKYEEKLDAA